jgi:capsular exopolysaccharide synthesis family protein
MSRIEEALRRAQLVESEPETAPDPGLQPAFMDIEPAVALAPAAYADIDDLAVEVREASPVDVAAAVDAPPPIAPPVPPSAAPAPRKRIDGKLVISPAVDPVAVEQYRKLAAALHQLQVERGMKVVMIASAMAGEGKTLTAANVAFTLSESFRRRTLLIDADLRRPTVDRLLDIVNVSGLNDALEAPEDRKLTIVEMSPRLSVLTAGRPNSDPMSGLTSARMQSIVQEAAAKFDWVVLDTPPIELLPDASLLAEIVDAVVLVIGAGHAPFRSIERAVNAIDRKRIIGVVLNRAAQAHESGYYGYGYYENRGSAN